MRKHVWLGSCLLCLSVWLLIVSGAQAGEVQVAVAANFVPTFKDIVAEFEKGSKHTVHINAGSSGKFSLCKVKP